MKKLYVPITVKELINRLNASFLRNLTVKSAPYLTYIKKEIIQQKDELREHMIQQWWESAKEFVVDKPVVYVKDMYEYLGVTESTVRRNCPELNEWISNNAKYSRQFQLQQTVDEYLVRIELAEDTLISQNKSASIEEIMRIAAVPNYIGYYYPDQIEALKTAKNRIQRNIELRKENDLN